MDDLEAQEQELVFGTDFEALVTPPPVFQYATSAPLWSTKDPPFFRDLTLETVSQTAKACVPTSLAILTHQPPEVFFSVNSQDPHSWSEALKPFGMKLAYCNTDLRPFKYLVAELKQLDDLFVVGVYCGSRKDITRKPRADGWVCGSHLFVVHRNQIYDPMGDVLPLDYYGPDYVKRIFRVVPVEFPREI